MWRGPSVLKSTTRAIEIAVRKAQELIAALERPIPTSVGAAQVCAAVGVVVSEAHGISTPSVGALFARAEVAEKLAKEDGPASAWHLWRQDDPPTVVHVRLVNG